MHAWFSLLSVGNKNDDPQSKVVETNDAQKFAEQMGIHLFETSAKENLNVEEVCVHRGPEQEERAGLTVTCLTNDWIPRAECFL